MSNATSAQRRLFKHGESGKIFILHFVTNIDAEESKRANWPIEAVYEDADGRIWSCPYDRFRKNLFQIDPRTGDRMDL